MFMFYLFVDIGGWNTGKYKKFTRTFWYSIENIRYYYMIVYFNIS